ncbi:MAG: FkbM family methyltransferase [Deltaproteobacteria bacterium]|nr:MAG: FkbM family methyltransferase [Deltaproteobacteria bacterium]
MGVVANFKGFLPAPVARFADEYEAVARAVDRGTLVRYTGAIARALPEILQTRLLAPADQRLGDRVVRVKTGGVTLRVPGRHFGLVRELYCRRVYNYLPGFEACLGQQVVDLGANVGAFSVLAAASGAKVLSVEAQDGFAPEFWELMRLNGCADRVQLVHGLIGAGAGVLSDPERRASASHMGAEPPTLRLADLLAERGIDRIDLLKVDIEGSEFAVFADGAGWLERTRRIVMEVHAAHGDPGQLARDLEAAGFGVTRLDTAGREVGDDFPGDVFLFAKRPG